MTLAIADRVWETSTSTGTGNFTLSGAVTGYRTFASVFAVSAEVYIYYCITDGTNWEVGVGSLSSSTVLIRLTLLSSSTGSFINFAAGVKQVFVTLPASQTVAVLPDNINGVASIPALNTSSSPYWVYSWSDCFNTNTDYYGLRIANSAISIGSLSVAVAFSHNTEYAASSGSSYGFRSAPTTASSLTSNGAGNSYGFYAVGTAPNVGGYRYSSTNICFYADSSIGTGSSYQFYANGTDPSIFNGPITGNGSISSGSSILSSSASAGIGYKSGAGSVQTQGTSKSTGVTLNNICGQITMNAAALAASTSVSFTLTNSRIAATDVVIVNVANLAGAAPTVNTYQVGVDAVLAGSCRIHVRNVSGTSQSQAIVLNYAVIKSVAS